MEEKRDIIINGKEKNIHGRENGNRDKQKRKGKEKINRREKRNNYKWKRREKQLNRRDKRKQMEEQRIDEE